LIEDPEDFNLLYRLKDSESSVAQEMAAQRIASRRFVWAAVTLVNMFYLGLDQLFVEHGLSVFFDIC